MILANGVSCPRSYFSYPLLYTFSLSLLFGLYFTLNFGLDKLRLFHHQFCMFLSQNYLHLLLLSIECKQALY